MVVIMANYASHRLITGKNSNFYCLFADNYLNFVFAEMFIEKSKPVI